MLLLLSAYLLLQSYLLLGTVSYVPTVAGIPAIAGIAAIAGISAVASNIRGIAKMYFFMFYIRMQNCVTSYNVNIESKCCFSLFKYAIKSDYKN